MTDNEKRAHDIATAMLPTLYNNKVNNIANGSIENNGIDIMAIYENTYNSCLNYLNSQNKN